MTGADRVLRIVAVLAGLLALGLGLALRRSEADHAWHPRAIRAIDAFAVADEALRRELFSARVGLTRHYDDLNRAVSAGEAALADLAALAGGDPALAAATAALSGRAQALNEAVERFKTDNALLQNALARFASLSEGFALTEPAGRLPASVLRLTLDTSANVLREIRDELDRLEAAGSERNAGVARTIAKQVRLLTERLPNVDGVLSGLRNDGIEEGTQRVRETIAARDRANRARHTVLLGLLAGAALTSAAAGTVLVLRGAERNRRMRRQGANDQLSATVAGLLLAPDRTNIEARVARALERIAAHAASPCAFLAVGDGPPRVVAWPDAWPDLADEGKSGFVRAVFEARATAVWDANVLALPAAAGGARNLLLLREDEAAWAVLGLEADAALPLRSPELVAGLRTAMAALVHWVRQEEEAAERVALERRLGEAERLEAIGTIASGVAHNFNNIIGAIGGFSEMARGRVRRGSAVAGHLDEIGQAVARARALIEDILGFAGRRPPPGEPVRLAALIAETAGLLRASFPPETAVLVRAEGDEGDEGDAEVVGSATRLQQVFMNLGNNARTAVSDRGTVAITLSRRTLHRAARLSHGTLAGGTYAVVIVEDDGPGVPATVFPRLFEPFFTTRPSGTGLGLSTAWQIVRDHGGTINVVSPSEGGSRFEVFLPLAKGDGSGGAHWRGAGERILLLTAEARAADDETLLARLGCEPVYLSYADLPGALAEALAGVDAVLAIDPPSAALPHLRPHAAGLPPMVAAAGRDGSWPEAAAIRLRLPLEEATLATALKHALALRPA